MPGREAPCAPWGLQGQRAVSPPPEEGCTGRGPGSKGLVLGVSLSPRAVRTGFGPGGRWPGGVRGCPSRGGAGPPPPPGAAERGVREPALPLALRPAGGGRCRPPWLCGEAEGTAFREEERQACPTAPSPGRAAGKQSELPHWEGRGAGQGRAPLACGPGAGAGAGRVPRAGRGPARAG